MAITVGSVTIRPTPGAAARAKRAVLVLGLLVAVVVGAPHAMASESPSAVPADTWTVAEGETLWSIATAITKPGEDVRSTLEVIKGLNALQSTAIRAGDQLLIPAFD